MSGYAFPHSPRQQLLLHDHNQGPLEGLFCLRRSRSWLQRRRKIGSQDKLKHARSWEEEDSKGRQGMDLVRAQSSLQAAHLCLDQGLYDSATNRAYFAMFQIAICALEARGIKRREWTHKGVHSDFVLTFVRRRKVVPMRFAGALPSIMQLRHIADYQHPGVSRKQAERAVRLAQEFVELLTKEV